MYLVKDGEDVPLPFVLKVWLCVKDCSVPEHVCAADCKGVIKAPQHINNNRVTPDNWILHGLIGINWILWVRYITTIAWFLFYLS